MEELAKLRKQLKAIDTAIEALLSADELTEEQAAEHARLEKDRAHVRKKIDNSILVEERAKERRQIKARETRLAAKRAVKERVRPGDNRVTAPAAGAALAGRDERVPATYRRHRLRNFRGVRHGMDAEQRALRFGMSMLAQVYRDMPGRYGHLREASDWVQRHFAATPHQTNNATGGLYLIPEEFSADLIDLREMYGVARQVMKVQPMATDTFVRPRRASGLTAYWFSEGGAITASNKTWDQVRLTARDLGVITLYSAQLEMDAVISIADDLAYEIAYAFANKEDEAAFNGDGTSAYGGIQGVRNKLDSIDGAGTDAAGKVIQGTSNTWSAMVLSDFNNVVAKLPKYADTPNAAWVCHKTFYHSVMEKLALAAGGVTSEEIADGMRQFRFMGYPVVFSQVYPSVTATSGVMVTLGDYGLAGMFGDRQQDAIAFSDSATVDSTNIFEKNMLAVRGTERLDINWHDLGTSSVVGPVVGLATS